MIGPFTRVPGALLGPQPDLWWADKDVFNPGAVVRNGTVHLLVRGEDTVGRFAGTSRIGIATSGDGFTFAVAPEPVLVPTTEWETEGGCEDPRVVEAPDGMYVCTYTGFDGARPRLMVATSSDLQTWTTHGLAFAGTPHEHRSAKSGAIVTELRDGRLVAARVNGRYWMYFGEGVMYAATSDDLVRWAPVEYDATADRTLSFTDGRWSIEWHPGVQALRPVLMPRAGRWDERLVEPGPPAVLTEDGIVLIYNGADATRRYAPGQAVFDAHDPTACIERATEPFLRPETADEQRGQVDNVCFAEGLVAFNGEWWLYFGMADSRIGCATASMR